MGKHNKHPDRSPGRNNNDLAANEPSKAKLAYKIIIFTTATVKLITEILHHTVSMNYTRFDYFRGVLIQESLFSCWENSPTLTGRKSERTCHLAWFFLPPETSYV